MLAQQCLIWASRTFRMGGQPRDCIAQISFSRSCYLFKPSRVPRLPVISHEIPCARSAFCVSNRELQSTSSFLSQSKWNPWAVTHLGFFNLAIFLFHSYSHPVRALLSYFSKFTLHGFSLLSLAVTSPLL